MRLSALPRHRLQTQHEAARANWHHDFSGRARREAVNDCPAGRIAVPSPASELSLQVGDAFFEKPVPRHEVRLDGRAAGASAKAGGAQPAVRLGA